MGRKHKYVNKTHYPDWVIERIARCLYDDMVAFCTSEEGQQECKEWESEQQRKADSERNKRSSRSGKIVALGIGCQG